MDLVVPDLQSDERRFVKLTNFGLAAKIIIATQWFTYKVPWKEKKLLVKFTMEPLWFMHIHVYSLYILIISFP